MSSPKLLNDVRKEAYLIFQKALDVKFSADLSQFFIKVPFNNNDQQVIAMFEQELKKDFYVELHRKNGNEYQVIDEKRVLYRWKFHKHLEEYNMIEKTDTAGERWLIPINELEQVSTYIDESMDIEFDSGPNTPIKNQEKLPELLDGLLLSDESLNDLFAIIHLKPVSNKQWLNTLINKHKNE